NSLQVVSLLTKLSCYTSPMPLKAAFHDRAKRLYMPCFKFSEVAQRLDAHESWLQSRISQDRRSNSPQLQFPHCIGTSPVWTMDAFESLKRPIAGEADERRQYRGNGRPTKGWTGSRARLRTL